ncbi:hypothetical protein Clacol_007788 [Clathrus columnatus]|uniref:chitinase n=1 Tax=Clathrus columnatus TaxID=1419009 RepID=A0AAV5AK85_9AGAM|nr:hypothetical protein Clacol_007788 [Clathrus columnatus]
MVFSKAQLFSLLTLCTAIVAFDITRFDNLAVYWGQNSYGATHTDVANFQKPIDFYCQDDTIDVIPVAFLTTFFGTDGLPVLNLANTCNNVDNATFPGSELPNCTVLAPNIEACQANGKVVTLSLGGAGGGVGFSSDAQATSFADQIWNLFLGGSSPTRPFGSAVLDGVDLDIENGGSSGYAAFISQLQTHFQGASKKDNWARTISPNPNVKIFIGGPASSTAAGGGYQAPNVMANIATITRNSFPSFGGVMLWDASQAYANNRYDLAIKTALTAAGGTGFTFPTCTAPAFSSSGNYPGGSEVSYGGYIWQAKWDATGSTPANNPNSDWSAISACTGNGAPAPASPTSTPSSPTSSHSSSSSTAPQPAPTSGNCAGIAAWSSSIAYTGGQQVTYGGDLWTAMWWTESKSKTQPQLCE